MRLLLLFGLMVWLNSFAAAQDSIPSADIVFEKVETNAAYPGGLPAWGKYLQKNLNANVPVKNGAPAGRYTVKVQFIVDKEGNIIEPKALTRLGYGMEDEVIRILLKSGQWKPAMQGGRNVKAYHVQPVVFLVQDDNIEINSDAGMYLLLAGKNNTITISAGRVKPADLTVTVSKGKITALGDGKFTVVVPQAGRTRLTVYGKNTKFIGEADLEVL